MSVSRLRIQGQLNEITNRDLRFEFTEADIFLNKIMQLNISSEDVQTIQERTEGWVAGLHMAALFLGRQKKISDFLSSFGGNHIHLSDYFMEEVIHRQPDHIQSFLYETAMLDRMCSSLCDAVTRTKNSGLILEEIEKANLFVVPLDEQGKWFRYHHLFAELLVAGLEKLDSRRLTQSHLRASSWFETHHYADEAIFHAMSAKDINRVTDLMEKFGADYLYRGKRKTVYRWLSLLPDTFIENSIIFNIVHAWVIFPEKTPSTYRKAKARLKNAEILFLKNNRDKPLSKYFTNQQIQGFIMALKVMIAREEGKKPEKIFALCGQAIKNLGEGVRGTGPSRVRCFSIWG